MGNDVIVLLLGTGEGAYALASAFAGDYGIPVCVMDEEISTAFSSSRRIKEVRTVSGMAYRGLFLRALSDFYEAYAGKSILLIPTTEAYTARVLEEREELERMFLLPQKKCLKTADLTFSPSALLLHYVGREGSVHTAYGEIAASSGTGAPLALITKPTPKELLNDLPTDAPHFALYAVSEKGECVPVPEAYAPFLAFPSAADLSLAEWMLNDYVLCTPTEEQESTPTGLFALFSYARTKRYLIPSQKACAKALRRKRLLVRLYAESRPCLRRFYRENWEKRTKAKK